MKSKNYILLLLLVFPIILFGQTEHIIQPNVADPLSGAPNNNHFVYTNQTVSQKNKLFLFFPGTGAVPFNYREILRHAANLGYHSIGLTYPNSDAINVICATTIDTTCHSRARLEVFDGIDRHPALNVDTINCIERRTLKLLQYLDANYPSENWGQYYSGNQIHWNNVIVSGHSQGGGHAGIISKIKQVERVAMFAAMDWISLLNRNADWITWNGPTPDNRYYGFIHQNDDLDFSNVLTTWDNYGMNSFGNLVLVDTTNTPYNNSHKLYTLLTPANDTTKFHGSPVADAYTPMNSGIPVYAPVWTYMIEGGGAISSITDQQIFEPINIFPNPVSSILHLNCFTCKKEGDYSIYNLQGQIVKNGLTANNKIDVSNLPSGVYILNFHSEDLLRTIKFIKD